MEQMTQITARCVEVIALQGRRGISIRELFGVVDPSADNELRIFMWRVLVAMSGHQLFFYRLVGGNRMRERGKKRSMKRKRSNTSSYESLIPVRKQKRPSHATKDAEKENDQEDQGQSDCSQTIDTGELEDTPVSSITTRDYSLGEEVDVSCMTYTQATASDQDSVGVMASEEFRLRALGVESTETLDASSPVYDLLELVGQAGVSGLSSASALATDLFESSSRFYYCVEQLVLGGYAVRRTIQDGKNSYIILYLKHFANESGQQGTHDINCTEGSPSFDAIAHSIAQFLRDRGQSNCILANIGHELGYSKKFQRSLRNHFTKMLAKDATFPLVPFKAKCTSRNQADTLVSGRSMWCLRLQTKASDEKISTKERTSSLVLESGLVEQARNFIEHRGREGLTITELGDQLQVPTANILKRLTNELIIKYDVRAEETTEGKAKSQRLFLIPSGNSSNKSTADLRKDESVEEGKRAASSSSTSKVSSEDRAIRILDIVADKKIVSMDQLQSKLAEMEQVIGDGKKATAQKLDLRSVRPALKKLIDKGKVITVSIALPATSKRQKKQRVIECIALSGCEQDADALRAIKEAHVSQEKEKNMMQSENTDLLSLQNAALTSNVSIKAKVVEDKSKPATKTTEATGSSLEEQSRQLGLLPGHARRWELLHKLLWQQVDRQLSEDACESPKKTKDRLCVHLQEVIDTTPIQSYMQLVGVGEPLSDDEMSDVQSAIAGQLAWDLLSDTARTKIRGREVDRFTNLIDPLIQLSLVHWEVGLQDSSCADTASSAQSKPSEVIVRLCERAKMKVKKGSKVFRKLPTGAELYLATSTAEADESESRQRLQLTFLFKSSKDTTLYWQNLGLLSTEGGRLVWTNGVQADESSGLEDKVWSAPLEQYNLHAKATWAMDDGDINDAKSTSPPKQVIKKTRKRWSNPKRRNRTIKAHQQLDDDSEQIPSEGVQVSDDTTFMAKILPYRPRPNASERASNWTLDTDLVLLDWYMSELKRQWSVDIPRILQHHDGEIALQMGSLHRTGIQWKEIGSRLDKPTSDCMLRIDELLAVPVVRARIQRTKKDVQASRNPTGVFQELCAIRKEPRLSALFTRILQILFHDESSYDAIVANALTRFWTEEEMKIVWRYLWISCLIMLNPSTPHSPHQARRTFALRKSVWKMHKTVKDRFPVAAMKEAASHRSFLDEKADVACLTERNAEDEWAIQYDLQDDYAEAWLATELACVVTGNAELVPKRMMEIVELSRATEEKYPPKASMRDHVRRCTGGIEHEDLAREFWNVTVNFQTKRVTECTSLEAFSGTSLKGMWTVDGANGQDKNIERWVRDAVSAYGETGVSVSDLCEQLEGNACTHGTPSTSQCSECIKKIYPCLEQLKLEGKIFQVSALDHNRYVDANRAELWSVCPYTKVESSNQEASFHFDKAQTVAGRPWIDLNGSTNHIYALRFKRQVLSVLLCTPGLSDEAITVNLHSLLGIQHVRLLLDEMISDDIVYCRAVYSTNGSRGGVFQKRAKYSIFRVEHGDHRLVDAQKEAVLRYFPTSHALEKLGAMENEIE